MLSDALLIWRRTLSAQPTFDDLFAVQKLCYEIGYDLGRSSASSYASIVHRTAQSLLQRGHRDTAQVLDA